MIYDTFYHEFDFIIIIKINQLKLFSIYCILSSQYDPNRTASTIIHNNLMPAPSGGFKIPATLYGF